MKRIPWKRIVVVLTILVGLCAGCGDSIKENEKAAVAALKLLRDVSAQFKDQDCDRNGIKDYWMADVSGLYRVLDDKGDEVQKIPREIALADGAPVSPIANYIGATLISTPVPDHGYYFRAMTTDELGSRYCLNPRGDAGRTAATNDTKFAFCAYPAIYEQTGKNVYIVSQERTIWKYDQGNASPILTWPHISGKGHWGTVE